MSAYPVAYNGTISTGGDSLTEDLNIYYNVRVSMRESSLHLNHSTMTNLMSI